MKGGRRNVYIARHTRGLLERGRHRLIVQSLTLKKPGVGVESPLPPPPTVFALYSKNLLTTHT